MCGGGGGRLPAAVRGLGASSARTVVGAPSGPAPADAHSSVRGYGPFHQRSRLPSLVMEAGAFPDVFFVEMLAAGEAGFVRGCATLGATGGTPQDLAVGLVQSGVSLAHIHMSALHGGYDGS